ncbi:MAG: response regulator [Rhodospirillales bacterium]|nr:response regulator [Rhodospirillales bacterium]
MTKKILLVDDDEFIRSMLVKYLTDAGYVIDQENNGADAFETLKSDSSYNLLITDIVMPNMTGCELMKALKKEQIRIPILAITGGMENAVEEYQCAADLFADKTLLKPIDRSVFLHEVEELIGPA